MQQQGSKITVQTRGIHPNFQLIQSKDPSMRTAYQFFKGEQEIVKPKGNKLDFDSVNQKFTKRKILLSTMGGFDKVRPTSNFSS
jgi:hypothetical protein